MKKEFWIELALFAVLIMSDILLNIRLNQPLPNEVIQEEPLFENYDVSRYFVEDIQDNLLIVTQNGIDFNVIEVEDPENYRCNDEIFVVYDPLWRERDNSPYTIVN